MSKILILPYGISASASKLDLQINSSNPLISTFSNHWKTGRFADSKWEEKITISITTLDELIKKYGFPNYIKIDVEGFEYEVLKGLSKKVGIISFEFTSEFFKDYEKCINYLISLGYEKFNFSLGEKKKFDLEWSNSEIIINKLKNYIKSDNLLWGDIYAM